MTAGELVATLGAVGQLGCAARAAPCRSLLEHLLAVRPVVGARSLALPVGIFGVAPCVTPPVSDRKYGVASCRAAKAPSLLPPLAGDRGREAHRPDLGGDGRAPGRSGFCGSDCGRRSLAAQGHPGGRARLQWRYPRNAAGREPLSGVSATVALVERVSPSIDVECGDCGERFALSVRREYAHRVAGKSPKCMTSHAGDDARGARALSAMVARRVGAFDARAVRACHGAQLLTNGLALREAR